MVDVSRGVVAEGMRVELRRGSTIVASGLGEFYRRQGIALPQIPFLDIAHYRFGLSEPKQHYHLPFKCTPWGYSCFRGGA